jgi:hypothetical protein
VSNESIEKVEHSIDRALVQNFSRTNLEQNFLIIMTNINVIEAVRSYINRMIEDCGPAIKGLVMDKETVINNNNTFFLFKICILGFYC